MSFVKEFTQKNQCNKNKNAFYNKFSVIVDFHFRLSELKKKNWQTMIITNVIKLLSVILPRISVNVASSK